MATTSRTNSAVHQKRQEIRQRLDRVERRINEIQNVEPVTVDEVFHTLSAMGVLDLLGGDSQEEDRYTLTEREPKTRSSTRKTARPRREIYEEPAADPPQEAPRSFEEIIRAAKEHKQKMLAGGLLQEGGQQ